MALAISYDDVKRNQKRSQPNPQGGTTGGTLTTKFFTSRTIPDFPHAGVSIYDPGRTSSSHFHLNDQFQIVVGGSGRLGGHQLTPYCVHFSRAYTPYGPLSADAGGLSFIAMRTHFDIGAQRLPNEMEQLKRVPNRQPWQTARYVDVPGLRHIKSGFQDGGASRLTSRLCATCTVRWVGWSTSRETSREFHRERKPGDV